MFVSIDKKTAKEVYDDGEDVYLTPCKCVSAGDMIVKTRRTMRKNKKTDGSFEAMYSEFVSQSCNPVSGQYPVFHLIKK